MMKKRWMAFCMSCAIGLGTICSAGAYSADTADQYQLISAGKNETAVIRTDGLLWMWGSNSYGQLANGGKGNAKPNLDSGHVDFGTMTQTAPMKVMDNVVSVSCSDNYHYTAAITSDGTLWMWGQNECGQLGFQGGNAKNEYIPIQTVPVAVMHNVKSVSCGDSFTVAIKEDDTLWAWGELSNCGINSYTPTKIMENVLSVSSGRHMFAALTKDHALWMYGYYYSNQSENGTTQDSTAPIKVMDHVASVSCSVSIAAIKTDGSLWMWGDNAEGTVGNGGYGDIYNEVSGTPELATPAKIMENVEKVCTRGATTAAIKTDGSLWVWGGNVYGALGNGHRGNSYIPQDIEGFLGGPTQTVPFKLMDNVVDVVTGSDHMVAVKSDNTLWAWGENSYGELGNHGAANTKIGYGIPVQTVPVKVLSNTAFLSDTSFYDVWNKAFYSEPVQWAIDHNITTGTSAHTFSPNQTCTTAQILSFLWRANESPVVDTNNPFTDVNANNYYYDAVRWAAENELVSGTVLNGDAPCTRADTVTYLWKLAGSPQTELADFDDVPADADYAQAVAWAVKENITTGTGASTFSPNAICTRGEIVTFLYRAFSK